MYRICKVLNHNGVIALDMNDSKGAGSAASSISITHTLSFKNKLNGTLNTFTEPTTNTGADASLFTWSGYNFSSL